MPASLPACLNQTEDRKPRHDAYDLAIHMELEGVTDQVAQSVYGYAGTLEMAQAYFLPIEMPRPKVAPPGLGQTLLEYFKGLAFALPVLISAVVMIRFSLSLWGGPISIEDAAAVAIGTLSSFLVTGGLVQVMAWRVLFLLTTGDPGTAASTCGLWCRRGVLALFGSGCAGWLVNGFFGWMPDSLALLAVGFHLALGMLWLASGALYVLEGMLWISAATAVGLAVAGSLHYGLGAGLY